MRSARQQIASTSCPSPGGMEVRRGRGVLAPNESSTSDESRTHGCRSRCGPPDSLKPFQCFPMHGKVRCNLRAQPADLQIISFEHGGRRSCHVGSSRYTAREDQHPVGLRSTVQKELRKERFPCPRCSNGRGGGRKLVSHLAVSGSTLAKSFGAL